MKKAFTLVEIMIVVVIIGLLTAMFIPAFQKVKLNRIEKSISAHQYVSPDDMSYYYKNKKDTLYINERKVDEYQPSTEVVIGGKVYILTEKK